MNNGMIGRYVIVRCRDAGVHCGVLESHSGRECILTDARRLWRWVPAAGAKWLSGLATAGITARDSRGASMVSDPVERIHLTEDSEIILCSAAAEQSLREIETDVYAQ